MEETPVKSPFTIRHYRLIIDTMINTLLTFKQAAELAGVHPNTIGRWVKEGKLHIVHRPVSNRPYITRDELERAITPVEMTEGSNG